LSAPDTILSSSPAKGPPPPENCCQSPGSFAWKTTPYPLDKANEALDDLRSGRLEGAAVITP
jgi:hypothetical protein